MSCSQPQIKTREGVDTKSGAPIKLPTKLTMKPNPKHCLRLATVNLAPLMLNLATDATPLTVASTADHDVDSITITPHTGNLFFRLKQ